MPGGTMLAMHVYGSTREMVGRLARDGAPGARDRTYQAVCLKDTFDQKAHFVAELRGKGELVIKIRSMNV
ncbi:hypothetical protein BC834DRAFT_862080 [Gloeopeniophorella convolvens]|nr:hypothetical protein BC834DRAFT_862080 [Gloeopeniophorella convolvens]